MPHISCSKVGGGQFRGNGKTNVRGDRGAATATWATVLISVFLVSCGAGGGSDLTQLSVRDTTSVTDPASGLREFRDCPECPRMVQLPPGQFLMGSPPGEEELAGNAPRPEGSVLAEKPQVLVEIDYPVAIGKYEVTFAEWDYCLAEGGCSYRPPDEGWGRGRRPVMNIARRDAEQYVGWLRRHTGQPYRLPSEAEWEYAARAGTTTARYWGDAVEEGRAVCDGCGSRWDGRRTAPVGSFEPNQFGLHDTLGNVTEWVADCWNPSHEGATKDGSARLEDSPRWIEGECRGPMKKGSAWALYAWTARAAYRSFLGPGPWRERTYLYGFRVARDL